MNGRSALGRVGGGLLAGLVGGLAMSLTMLVLRTVVGISPPLEMIPDRFAPTLTIDQFFGLIGQFGGYNELKQFGVGSVLTGQLVVAAFVGAVYGSAASAAQTAARPILDRRRGGAVVRLAGHPLADASQRASSGYHRAWQVRSPPWACWRRTPATGSCWRTRTEC